MALTKAQEKEIQKQKDNYAKAYASRDYAGMRAANEAANKIRTQAGVATYDSSKGDAQRAGLNKSSSSSSSLKSSGASSAAKGVSSGAKSGVSKSSGSVWRAAANDSLYGGTTYRTDFDYGTAINNGLDNGMSIAQLASYAKSALAKLEDDEYSKYSTTDRVQLYESLLKQYDEQKEKEDELAQMRDELLNFQSQYESDLNAQLAKLQNREAFSYNPEEDLLYQIAAERYAQMGDEAMNNTLAEYSSMTGGLPSSYAVAAAQQAKSNYDRELSDMIPALQEAAYQRYMGDYQMDYNLLSSLIGLQGQSYEQFADAMSKGIGINEYLANLGYQRERDSAADSQWQQAFDYQVSRDKVLDEQWLMQFNEAQRQALINEAIDRRQISVSEGNLALSRAKYSSEQAEGQDDTVSYAYYCMVNGLDPKTGADVDVTGNDWLNKYAHFFSDKEFKDFIQYVNDEEDDDNRYPHPMK